MFVWIDKQHFTEEKVIDTLVLTSNICLLFEAPNDAFGFIPENVYFYDDTQRICVIPLSGFTNEDCQSKTELSIYGIRCFPPFKRGKKRILIHQTEDGARTRNTVLRLLVVDRDFSSLDWRP